MSKLHDLKDLIHDLAELLDKSSLSEIELEDDDVKIRLARELTVQQHVSVPVAAPAAAPMPVAPAASATAADPAPSVDAAVDAVKSPMVGTAYNAPEPNAPPFIREGQNVKEGDTLLIVEAMKVMNPIPSPKSGKVSKIMFSNGDPVEYGQPLVVIE